MKIMPEFGTVRENEAACAVAVAAITSGDLAWGHGILVALRDHIQSTAEHKSVQWILPKVLEALEALDTSLLTTASLVREEPKESGRCSASEIGCTKIPPHIQWGGYILLPLCRSRPLPDGTRGVARQCRASVVGEEGTAPAARRECVLVAEGNEEPLHRCIFPGHVLP